MALSPRTGFGQMPGFGLTYFIPQFDSSIDQSEGNILVFKNKCMCFQLILLLDL